MQSISIESILICVFLTLATGCSGRTVPDFDGKDIWVQGGAAIFSRGGDSLATVWETWPVWVSNSPLSPFGSRYRTFPRFELERLIVELDEVGLFSLGEREDRDGLLYNAPSQVCVIVGSWNWHAHQASIGSLPPSRDGPTAEQGDLVRAAADHIGNIMERVPVCGYLDEEDPRAVDWQWARLQVLRQYSSSPFEDPP